MNFYNEHDPKAAAWIRELIAAKLIPDGIVDERSILEIQPHELTRYTQCHFFAGIGGWSLALALAGWPSTRPVWTGSCPCQPFSNAGKGLAQADERHLWPVFFNLIRECRPECVFGEQVESAIGKGWLDGIQTDLEGEGYALGSVVLGAHSLGAPHIRQRLFWGADSILGGQRGRDERGLGAARQQVGEPENGARAANEPRDGREDAGTDSGVGDTEGRGRGEQRNEAQQGNSGHVERTGGAGLGGVARSESGHGRALFEGEWEGLSDTCRTSENGRMADTGYSESSRRELHAEGSDRGARDEPAPHGADGDGVAHSEQQGLEGHAGNGDDGHEPGRLGADEARPASASGAAWDSFDILPCRDGKARRVESGTFPLVDGIPGGVVPGSDPSVSEAQATAESRVMRLKGYGNAIVPAVAAEFLIAYLEIKSEP